MKINKRPVITWLLQNDIHEIKENISVPDLTNQLHAGYLANGINALINIQEANPRWGLPELLMPSFEKVMKKSAKAFLKLDHQLFQEFSETDECGILITKETGTVVYGFGENTLYVWMFKESNGKSLLYMYFYAVSTEDNIRQIYTWPSLKNDPQIFLNADKDNDDFYSQITNLLMVYLAVKKYAQIETIIVPTNKTMKFDSTILGYKATEKVRNESGQEVIVMDSRWFTKIVNDNDIFVRGFFRMQNKKNKEGIWYKELIFIDPFIRHGYHRNAKMEDD